MTSAGAGGGSGVRCFGSTVPRGQNPEDTQYSKLKISSRLSPHGLMQGLLGLRAFIVLKNNIGSLFKANQAPQDRLIAET